MWSFLLWEIWCDFFDGLEVGMYAKWKFDTELERVIMNQKVIFLIGEPISFLIGHVVNILR